MVIKYLVLLALTGFATSLSPLERSLHHSITEYKAGTLWQILVPTAQKSRSWYIVFVYHVNS